MPDLEDSKVSNEQMAHEYGANESEFSERNVYKDMVLGGGWSGHQDPQGGEGTAEWRELV